MLLGAVFVLGNAGDHPLIAILFISLVWAAIHAELVSSARIRGLGTHIDHAGGGSVRLATPLVSSLSTTAWTVILGVIIFRAWHTIPDWLVPAAMTGASGVLGMTLAGHLRVLRDIPETDAERLGAGLLVQAGGCLFAAIALALSGELEVLAWMGLGVAAAACGRWLHTRAFSVYGLISLAVATARLLVWDSWVGATAVPDAAVYGILISHWMGLTAVAGVLWLALAALVRRDEKSAWSTCAGLAAWAGIALLAACFLHEGAALTSLCLVWCVLALVVAGLAEVLQGLTLRWAALALWIVAAITWAIAYPFDTWNNRAWSLAVHPGAVMVLILAASGLAMGWWLARRESRSAAFAGAAIVVVLLVFAGSTLEVGRVVGVLAGDVRSPRAAVSIWWGLFACALIAGGFRRRTPGVRWTGLALLGVAGIKAVLFDLAGVSDIARIISFVGLGLLMLGVALVYSKVSATLEEPKVVPSPLPSKPDSGFDAA